MTLTTTQAAALAGMTPGAFRKEMSRERQRGRDYRLPGPDARTPCTLRVMGSRALASPCEPRHAGNP